MTPRGEVDWVDADLSVAEIRQQLLSLLRIACSRYVGARLDEIIDLVRAKELLVALERGADVCGYRRVFSGDSGAGKQRSYQSLLGVFACARGSFRYRH